MSEGLTELFSPASQAGRLTLPEAGGGGRGDGGASGPTEAEVGLRETREAGLFKGLLSRDSQLPAE